MKLKSTLSLWAFSLLAAGSLLSACQEPGEALTDRKRRENEAEIEQYIKQNNLVATKTDEGIYFVQTKSVPTGQAPVVGDEVRYHFVAQRLDGTIVDSTNMAADNPATVVLAGNQTTGITLGKYAGILKLRAGEEGSVLVPAQLDGGRIGSLLLPQYSPVRYDLRIVSVRNEKQQIDDYIRTNKLTVTTLTTDSIRVIKTLVQPSDSVAITAGKSVTVNYKGRRASNGNLFDSGTGYKVTIGEKRNVPGFENGLSNLRAGEKAILIFPSALGYGVQGSPSQDPVRNILPYAPLVFEIEVTKVE
ncbi:FKBP-type peptidyl-prolyl cis-trans isomerase [Spirosoma fluminis]